MSEPEWHDECRRLRALGLGKLEIGRRLGKSHGSVCWVLNEHGEREKQRIRNKARWDREKPPNGSDRYWRVTACRKYRAVGLTVETIAERLGKSESWVKSILRIKDEPAQDGPQSPRAVRLRAIKPVPQADRNAINMAAARAFAAGYIDAAELRRRLA